MNALEGRWRSSIRDLQEKEAYLEQQVQALRARFAGLKDIDLTLELITTKLTIAIGVLGFVMRKLDFPIAPTILGAILATEMERQFRRAMVSSHGDLSVFWNRPVTLVILVLALAAFALPQLPRIIAVVRGRRPGERLAFGDED